MLGDWSNMESVWMSGFFQSLMARGNPNPVSMGAIFAVSVLQSQLIIAMASVRAVKSPQPFEMNHHEPDFRGARPLAHETGDYRGLRLADLDPGDIEIPLDL